MSQYAPEEPDPLLAFSAEPPDVRPDPPAEPAAQPIVASAVPAFVSPPPIAQVSTQRVERIEQALEQSKRDLVLLTSQVTTLVGSIADINKQVTRMRAPTVVQRARTSVQRVHVSTDRLRSLRTSAKALFGSAADLRMSAAGLRNLMAFAALVVGLTIALATWRYWGGDAATAEPVAQAAQVTPPQATAAPEAATESVTSPQAAPQPASEPLTPALPKRVQYVGTLSIDATPGGEVFINRKRAGRTPLRVPNLRAGSHLVWVERDGYRRWTRVVNVPADRVSRVSAELEAIAVR